MMGMGVTTCRFTPSFSSRIEVTFDGSVFNNVAGGVAAVDFRFGTGAGPANGAAVTGTTVGNQPQYGNGSGTNQSGLSITRIVTGLTPGTTYWLDLSLSATTGTSTIRQPTCTAKEI
jgi:hypothetical protein